jgi:hypothetical protein
VGHVAAAQRCGHPAAQRHDAKPVLGRLLDDRKGAGERDSRPLVGKEVGEALGPGIDAQRLQGAEQGPGGQSSVGPDEAPADGEGRAALAHEEEQGTLIGHGVSPLSQGSGKDPRSMHGEEGGRNRCRGSPDRPLSPDYAGGMTEHDPVIAEVRDLADQLAAGPDEVADLAADAARLYRREREIALGLAGVDAMLRGEEEETREAPP